jgi:hypothetical protein
MVLAQPLPLETFNGAGFPPTNWSRTKTGTQDVVKDISLSSTCSFTTAGNVACARFDSYNSASNTNNCLITPAINLTGYSSATLNFKLIAKAPGGFYIDYSTNGGTTFTNGSTNYTTTSTVDFENKSINLSSYLGQSNLKIRFRCVSNFGNNYCYNAAYIDQVEVVGTLSCTNPTITASSGGSRCGTGTVGISATASAGTIEWFAASTGGTSLGSSSSGISWTTPSISATTTYYAEAVNGSCRSAARTAVTATVNGIPGVPVAVNGSGCGTGTVTLGVTTSPTGTINWYTDAGLTNLASGGGPITACPSGATCTTNWTTPSISSTTTYYARRTTTAGCNSAGVAVIATVNPVAIPGTFQYADGSTQSICAGSTISCSNSTSPTAGSGTLGVVWYCGELIDGSPGPSGTYGNWLGTIDPSINYSIQKSTNLIAAIGGVEGSGFSLTHYNPQSDFPGKTNFRIIRRAYNSNCGVCTGGCIDQTFYLTINANPSAPTSVTPSATTICHGNSVNLNATSAGNTINWYTVATDGTAIQTGVTSATNHSVSPTANTTYYAEAQNGSGCKSSRVATGLVTVENPVSAVNSAIGTTLQNNDYLWVGQTNSTWSTANNWRQFNGTNLIAAASAPGSDNTNRIYVVQNSTSSNCIFNATSLSLGGALGVTSLFVGTGTSLNLNNQNVDLSGNITINGTFTPGSGTLTLTGSANQTLDGTSALSFSNITINKSGGTLTAAKDMTITGTLTLTSGILDMNSKTLTMGTSSANGTITGGSASSYIVALDAATPSKLIHNVNSTSNATYSFPIGTGSAYTPVTVVMKGGTLENASIQVWTKNSRVTGINPNLSRNLNRSWYVIQSGITSPSYDIEYKYADVVGEITGSPTEDLVPFKLSGETWYAPTNSLVTNCTKIGSYSVNYTTRTLTWSGLNSFSEFGGGGGNNQPLPVELVSFNGACEDGNVHLSWQTASEFNSSHFDVEKSRDGENWQVIETIPAAGNSHELLNYETFDQVSNALNYYRLNQVDIDGTNKRYDPIAVSCEASSYGIFITYPNPSNEGFNILINDNELEGEMNMNIYTAAGSITLQKRIVVKESINVFMMNEKLLPGVYFIEIKDQQNKTKVIKHMVN